MPFISALQRNRKRRNRKKKKKGRVGREATGRQGPASTAPPETKGPDATVDIEYVTEEPEIYDPNFVFFKRIFDAFKVCGAGSPDAWVLPAPGGQWRGLGSESSRG